MVAAARGLGGALCKAVTKIWSIVRRAGATAVSCRLPNRISRCSTPQDIFLEGIQCAPEPHVGDTGLQGVPMQADACLSPQRSPSQCSPPLPHRLSRANFIFLVQEKHPGFTYDPLQRQFVRDDGGAEHATQTLGSGYCMAQVGSWGGCMGPRSGEALCVGPRWVGGGWGEAA